MGRVEHKPFRALTLRLQHCKDGSSRDIEPTGRSRILHSGRTSLADRRLKEDKRIPPIAPVVSLHNLAGLDCREHIGVLVVGLMLLRRPQHYRRSRPRLRPCLRAGLRPRLRPCDKIEPGQAGQADPVSGAGAAMPGGRLDLLRHVPGEVPYRLRARSGRPYFCQMTAIPGIRRSDSGLAHRAHALIVLGGGD